MRPTLRRYVVITAVLGLAVVACKERIKTTHVVEPYEVVPGTPKAESKTPGVEIDPRRDTDQFTVNVPRQCDVFQQVNSRKVDILWVVDSSGSMGPKQQRLAANFQGFINQLANSNPPIDFHIGVATTDTDDPATRGKLRRWTLGSLGEDYISCAPTMAGSVACNTGATPNTAVQAFSQLAQVGTTGSSAERGLYAAYLVLTNNFNISTSAVDRFVRPEAALYVVIVSDEDDSSCNPLTRQTLCTADPGCRCAPESALAGTGAFGSVAYFTRFFETYKGFGNDDAVAVAAIVAVNGDAGVPSQFGDPSQHVGCCRGTTCPTGGNNDAGYEVAYYGDRYVRVAAATGGVAVSICEDDFSGALASLGYSASGLRREFRLTRGPDVAVNDAGVISSITAFVAPPNAMMCQTDGNCPAGLSCRSSKCSRRVDIDNRSVTDAAEYVKCDSAGLRNLVRFNGMSVPAALSTVELCYDVLASFDNSCM